LFSPVFAVVTAVVFTRHNDNVAEALAVAEGEAFR
jgi:hypothetical protein